MPTPRRPARAASARAAPSVDYEALADLRYHIRRFLRRREVAARSAGFEPQQYLVLLQVKALQARQAATIGALAERLQVRHHAAVQLLDRLARSGMVERHRGGSDRRAVVVALRPSGDRMLARLARYSVAELKTEAPALVRSLSRLVAQAARRGRGRRPRSAR